MPVDKSYLDTYRVKNLTDRTVTLGDLVNVSIPPKAVVDLLKYPRVNKEKINQSKHLQQAIKSGLLELLDNKISLKQRNEKKAILPFADYVPEGVTGSSSALTIPFSNTDSVNVTHNLGAYPVVQVIDSNEAVIIPLTIVHTSINTFIVTFDGPITGNIITR